MRDATEAGRPWRDRTFGIRVAGAVLLVASVLALLVSIVVAGTALLLLTSTAEAGPPLGRFVPALVLYPGMAIAFGVLGGGLLARKRWARTLALVVAWPWLAVGLVTVVTMAFSMGSAMDAAAQAAGGEPMPAGLVVGVVAFTLVMLSLVLVLLPAGLLAALCPRDARATVEHHDPRPRWTDRHPVAVLIVVLWLGVTALVSLAAILNPLVPAFGTVLRGPSAVAYGLGVGAIAAVLAVGAWRRARWAWWGALAFAVVLGAATAASLPALTVDDVLAIQGAQPHLGPEQLREQAEMTRELMSGPVVVAVAVSGLLQVLLLLVARPHFVRRPPREQGAMDGAPGEEARADDENEIG